MRSLPDIFKHPFFQLREDDVALIPEAPPDWLWETAETAETAEAAEGGAAAAVRSEGEGEDDEPEAAGQEDESPESVVSRYRQRLALSKEAFFDALLPEFQEELRRRTETALDRTYREALLERREEIRQSLDVLSRGLEQLQEAHRTYIKEFTEELKYMALDIAEKILQKEITADPGALETMTLQLVSEVKNTPWINVEVSEQTDGLAQRLKRQLSKAEQGKNIFVTAKDIPADGCRIETEDGIIDATLSVQLSQLRQAFVQSEEEGD
jgi:flagellar assembly protein FliH